MRMSAPSGLEWALHRRGLRSVADLLTDMPSTYEPWRGALSVNEAVTAATWLRFRGEAELNERDLDLAGSCVVILDGTYEATFVEPFLNALLTADGSELPNVGTFRSSSGAFSVYGVPAAYSGHHVWTIGRISVHEDGPLLSADITLPTQASEVIPRWDGLSLAMSAARLITTARILAEICEAAPPQSHEWLRTLSVAHTPDTWRAIETLTAEAKTAALRWMTDLPDLPAQSTAEPGRPAPPLPEPRMLKGHAAAEDYAAEVVAALGFREVSRTPPGADGGIDVIGEGVVVQVKMEALPTGRERLQALFGIAAVEGAQAIFFSLSGYTAQALQWADRAGVALFEFEFDGTVMARNPDALRLLSDGAPVST